MNQHLQKLLDFIQQADHLTAEEKPALLKSLKDADSAFTISQFKLERTEKVKRTTAILLEETIEELEQKRKAVEAQNKEMEIEAALEKVRSRSLAMHKSDELQDVVNTVFESMKALEIDMNVLSIFIFKEGSKDWQQWVATSTTNYSSYFHIPYVDLRVFKNLEDAKKSGKDFYSVCYSFEEKNEWFNYAFNNTEYRRIPGDRKKFLIESEFFLLSFALAKNTGIQIAKYSGKEFSENENEILKRFARVFEQAYIRFMDLQKAEAQAREAKIEAALEKVRSRTMAMQKSEDLNKAASDMFKEIQLLGMLPWACGFNIFEKDEKAVTQYMSLADGGISPPFRTPLTKDPFFINICNARKRGDALLVWESKGESLAETYRYMFSLPGSGEIFGDLENSGFEMPKFQITHCAYFSQGYLVFITYEPVPEAHDIFKRFAKVFDQTYTRFLDLQKAEAQAREAKIEAALERVRSRSMAMHKSEELLDVISVVSEQLQQLDFKFIHVSFANNDKSQDYKFWTSSIGMSKPMRFNTPYLDIAVFNNLREAQEKSVSFFTDILTKEEHNQWHTHLLNHGGSMVFSKEENEFIMSRGMARSIAINPNIILILANYASIPYSEEENKIIERFGKVFEQSYTRFLDLQKAEAQAREAQIETALEKVRSRSLAMHKSDELQDVVNTVFERLHELNIEMDSANIAIFKEGARDYDYWIASPFQKRSASFHMPYIDLSLTKDIVAARESGADYSTKAYSFEEKNEWFNYAFQHTDFKFLTKERKQFILNSPGITVAIAFSKHTGVQVNRYSDKFLYDGETEILKRFSKVFEQAYIRFNDLQKAEAQTREAQIEAALERVRGRAMAMQNSDELSGMVAVLFEELTKLNLILYRCIIWIFNADTSTARIWMANSEDKKNAESYFVKKLDHPYYNAILKGWKERNPKWIYDLKGEDKKSIDTLLLNETELSRLPEAVKKGILNAEHSVISGSFNNFGLIEASGPFEHSDEQLEILSRFGKVFDLSYTRFNDLQQAEASTKLAIKQAALDRIRADIASMRTISDLDRITPLIWNELTILGIPFIRCGVFIMDESQQQVHTFLSTPDGKAIAAFHLPYDTPGNLRKAIDNWHHKEKYIDHWDEREFTQFAEILAKQGALQSAELYLKTIPHGGFYLHFLPFLQGMLYVGNTTQLGKEEINLVQSVAEAFSTAYARYEDFNKLEAAKKQVDSTLNDLQITQKQLIQSEKMASLGELTAGIAHEIQNPLNFVNNFSEVSSELLDEMMEEVAKGNFEEVKDIMNDIKQNLEKINHHGKRADGIVKGMLQHSRSSSAVKEPTDINKLADEYLRLTFHGFRAKDKSFNAVTKTHYEDGLEKVNVIPQEMGRVILNLITNAFYVVNEKKKSGIDGYEPTVTVSTKKLNGMVEVSVADNGNGIPQKILDKIFQPFFTTKPTGQGTGLGLSLAYDIVKAHGGEIKVKTREGEGSEFIIQLPVV